MAWFRCSDCGARVEYDRNRSVSKCERCGNEENDNKAKSKKYHNEPHIYNGVWYASKKEANFAIVLDDRMKKGDILWWGRQVRFPLLECSDSKIPIPLSQW